MTEHEQGLTLKKLEAIIKQQILNYKKILTGQCYQLLEINIL